MKKLFTFKWLLLSIVLSIAGVGQVWAETLVLRTDVWNYGSAWFAACFRPTSGNDTGAEWVEMTQIGTSQYYYVDIPENMNYLLFVRMNNEKSISDEWNGKWDNSPELTISGNENKVYNVTGWGAGNVCTGSWGNSLYTKDKVIYCKVPTQWQDAGPCILFNFYADDAWIENVRGVQIGETQYYSATIPNKYSSKIEIVRYGGEDCNTDWGGSTSKLTVPSGTENCIINSSTSVAKDQTATWGKYAPVPAIGGTMNDWSPVANQFSGSPLTLTMDLLAGTAYEFKVANGETWYGQGSNSYDLTYVGQDANAALSSSGQNIMLLTERAGTYTFTWDGTNLKVDYPTVIAHPSINYVYVSKEENSADWNDGNYCYAHHWYTDGEGDHQLRDWITLSASTTINEKEYYYFPILTDYPNFVVKSVRGDGGYGTGNQVTTDNEGKYVYWPGEGSWTWDEFVFSITYKDQGNVDFTGSHDDTGTSHPTTHTFGTATTLKTATRAGYTFSGWYTNSACTGDAVTSLAATEYTENITLYAKWTPKTMVYSTGGNWSATANWTDGVLPTINHDVIIQAPVTVNIEHATAKSIVIDQNGKTGRLTIQANKGLEVAETITKTTDGETYTATEEADLVLESSSAGNASLIFNNSNSCKATVQLYAKGTIDGETWNWQYVGTPFTGSIPLYNYYGSWMYKWNNGWEVVNGNDELYPFAGYCLTQETATTHVMGGTLVSATSKEVTMGANTDKVLANSWTAPISIACFTASTFTSTPATIYLFNTGDAEDGADEGIEAGTYITVPISSAPYTGNGLIAPMQGFFVTTSSGSAGTITMNYADLVRPSGDHTTIVGGPMHAPKNENHPNVLKIWADGSVYNDRVVILEREDFSTGFDNGWDGEKLNFGTNSPSVYVINEQNKYDAVSAIPDFDGTKVGFRAGTDKEFTIRFNYTGEETLYLNDVKENKSTQINDENTYSFTAESTDNEARFVISKSAKMPMSVDEITSSSPASKQLIDGELFILRDGKLYNATGALVK